MKTISRYIMTLALLLTAVTGAWAQDSKVYASGDVELSSLQVGDILLPGVTLKDNNNSAGANIISNRYSKDGVISQYSNSISSIPFSIGENGLLTAKIAGDGPYNCMPITEDGKAGNAWVVMNIVSPTPESKTILIGGTTYLAPSDVNINWDAATKTGTFVMPAFDVEIDPIYAPAAQWAKVENVDQLPTAIEGIFAGTTDAIVKAGTVAMMGETENPQGQVMYALTSINQATAPALDAFSATVPTAENIADEGADVLIWYYIQGANTPDGEEATAENTFNDSEIFAEPIKVTVLPNKYDIQFNAANDNTIEAGKATVTVGGTAATVTEGKLEGVKMGTEVKVKANTGYKFRKVEVKKSDGSKRLDESTVGMIVCTNGKAYPVNMKDNLPSGVTAVGIVAYKNGKNGLVMALTDEATNMNWDTANGNNGAKAHTPAVEGYSWKVPAIGEWQYNIFTGAGVGNLAGLSTYMTAAGGTGLQNGGYWTSTPKNNGYYARCITIENGSINFSPGSNTELKTNGYHVRAVFAF
ncbi:DUF1566 domain-containing protein [Prevotella communis]|uniref:DUF1566 domain-containing protein n=1 Tax=Prevotella communis TaxID=2913614 RepID=UPI001EDBC6B6|nr:DUF1566 domain-containing protein [Prevotella communis]UKK56707.1 DUF1566 domain-containing protein [Prevotella communis]